MLRPIPDLPAGIIGVAGEGRVTGADYRETWRPLLARARREGRRLRVLYRLGPDFDGFTGGPLWEDLRLGFEYLHDFERCAVVSDREPLRIASELAGVMVPCRVRAFEGDEEAEAMEWLTSSGGGESLSFRLLPECGVLLLEPDGSTTREDVESVQEALDSWADENGENGRIDALVIAAADPSIWRSPASVLRHWQLLRDDGPRLKRVAVVAEGAGGDLMSAIGDAFTSADLRRFEPGRRAEAISWAARGTPSIPDPAPAR
ncbi:MAG: STAS/SEC14 domain-containing protein [Gemmatimonadota bacterium]|jgi:hypothetical protein